MKQRETIVIPKFIFTDGEVGTFNGYVRGCCPFDFSEPRYIDQIGIFDDQGRYFKIHVDCRRERKRKRPTFSIDGKASYNPIVRYFTINRLVNPKNGHLIPGVPASPIQFR